MKRQHSIAIVNDISGFGRCSITVALPILSAMKIQCGVLPTAILSNHTEYPEYTMLDFTEYMEDYLAKWEHLGLSFEGIYTGYLGSERQLEIILRMFQRFSFEKKIIDPVMGDHGKLYPAYTQEMCQTMKELTAHSTLTTPNVTELCILTDTPYRPAITEEEIFDMCKTLGKNGAKQIVVTGIESGQQIGNAVYDKNSFQVLYQPTVLPLRPGTGDVFASILAGCSLHNIDLTTAVTSAAQFIRTCLLTSADMDIPLNDGVCFEEHLNLLMQLITANSP